MDEFGLTDCPHCLDAVVNLTHHLTWCLDNPENRMTDTSGLPQVTDITPLVSESQLETDDMIATLRRIADRLGHDLIQRDTPDDGASEKVIRL